MIDNKKLIFRVHALSRMGLRGFDPSDVRSVLNSGTVIEHYADDTPYPSCLVMAIIAGRPVHVVAACNELDQEVIVITVYEPDPKIWSDGFTRRIL